MNKELAELLSPFVAVIYFAVLSLFVLVVIRLWWISYDKIIHYYF